MTIQVDSTQMVKYTSVTVESQLSIPFRFLELQENVKAFWRLSDGTEQELTYGTDYTITTSDGTGGVYGTLSFTSTTEIPEADYICIYRDVPISQTKSFDSQTIFASTTEFALDKLTLLQQDNSNKTRFIRASTDTDLKDDTLELPPMSEWSENAHIGFKKVDDEFKIAVMSDDALSIKRTIHQPLDETEDPTFEIKLEDRKNKILGFNEQGSVEFQDSEGLGVQSDWASAIDTSPSYIKNKPALAAVATSGSYNDLENKLTPGVNITIENNEISAADSVYELPIASDSTLGGVKIGEGISSNNGVISSTEIFKKEWGEKLFALTGTVASVARISDTEAFFVGVKLCGIITLGTEDVEYIETDKSWQSVIRISDSEFFAVGTSCSGVFNLTTKSWELVDTDKSWRSSVSISDTEIFAVGGACRGIFDLTTKSWALIPTTASLYSVCQISDTEVLTSGVSHLSIFDIEAQTSSSITFSKTARSLLKISDTEIFAVGTSFLGIFNAVTRAWDFEYTDTDKVWTSVAMISDTELLIVGFSCAGIFDLTKKTLALLETDTTWCSVAKISETENVSVGVDYGATIAQGDVLANKIVIGAGLSVDSSGTLSAPGTAMEIVDSLDDSSSDKALSANMGKTLNEIKQDNLIAGENIKITDNVISASGGGYYELPEASSETLGGVKIGNGVDIDDGVLSSSKMLRCDPALEWEDFSTSLPVTRVAVLSPTKAIATGIECSGVLDLITRECEPVDTSFYWEAVIRISDTEAFAVGKFIVGIFYLDTMTWRVQKVEMMITSCTRMSETKIFCVGDCFSGIFNLDTETWDSVDTQYTWNSTTKISDTEAFAVGVSSSGIFNIDTMTWTPCGVVSYLNSCARISETEIFACGMSAVGIYNLSTSTWEFMGNHGVSWRATTKIYGSKAFVSGVGGYGIFNLSTKAWDNLITDPELNLWGATSFDDKVLAMGSRRVMSLPYIRTVPEIQVGSGLQLSESGVLSTTSTNASPEVIEDILTRLTALENAS